MIHSLEVTLNKHTDQVIPFIQYELPYSFDVVTKLPPRPRNEGEGGDDVDDVDSHPHRAPIMVADRASRVGPTAPQSVGPSSQGQLSSGDSRRPTDSTSSHSNERLMDPTDNPRLPSPREVAIRPRQPVTEEETTLGTDPILQEANPSRGPTTGGLQIWIEGSDFPADLTPLYARFGDNFARVVGTLFVSFDHRLIEPRLSENPI